MESLKPKDNSEKIKNSENKCKICFEEFKSLQEVLKHELLNHSSSKDKKLPSNQLKRRVNVVLKTINADEEKKSRQELAERISDCRTGTELDVIFKKYQMNDDDLFCIYTRVHTSLKEELDKIGPHNIYAYGSIANGLALKTSDIDLHIVAAAQQHHTVTYKHITRALYRSKCFTDIVPIRNARVPIIKCVHIPTGFSLDINTCESYGIYNSKFIHDINQCDPRIHKLILFLKIWSKSMHIYGAFGMTNYCLTTLAIFFLQKTNPPALASIKIMQRNATKRIINGINFGINIRSVPLDSRQNVHELIKGFFAFYSTFDFGNYIIAPYLGKVIKKTDFQNNLFKYPEYESQLKMFSQYLPEGEKVETLRTDRPVCVQDMFCLNLNVAKGLSETNVQYFQKCLTMAHKKCCEPNISLKQLYKRLLVDVIDEFSQIFPVVEPIAPLGSSAALTIDIVPRKNEVRALAKFTDNPLDLQKLWVKEYIDAIEEIITKIYKIDMTLLSPTQSNKLKKIDEAENSNISFPMKWSISSYVDLWSGRQMVRNSGPFMEFHMEQTEKLHAERRQESAYTVQFKGYVTITVNKSYNAIHLEVSNTAETLTKKDPLRKFFGSLKCCIQSYNLKHRIHQLEEQKRADSDTNIKV